MKPCPHCGNEVRFWRLWSAARWTHYDCPNCGGRSEVALASRIWFALLGPLPALALGVVLLNYLDIQSRIAQVLFIAPIALAGSFLMGYLLARFGRFHVLGK
jgi:hypothetical protein